MKLWIIVLCVILGIFLYAVVSFEFVLRILIGSMDNFFEYFSDEQFSYPIERPSWVPKDAFVLNMHAHTRASDGILTPHQLIHWHIRNGYNGCAITDHNTADFITKVEDAAKEIDPQFVVIPGVEASSFRLHFNIYGMRSYPWRRNEIWFSDYKIRQMIKYSHKHNFLVQFNHRMGSNSGEIFPLKKIYELGFDGIEIRNGASEKYIDLEAEKFIDNLKKRSNQKQLFKTGGMDFHTPITNIRYYTEFTTKDHTINGILTALRNGNTIIHSPPDLEQEQNRTIPEKGTSMTHPKFEKYRKKWIFLATPGVFVYKIMMKILIYISSRKNIKNKLVNSPTTKFE
jgi:hypothetical protein